MDSIIVILLIIALVKSVFFGYLLLVAFRPDVKQMRSKKEAENVRVCVYCGSKWTKALDEGETRWDNEDLLLVTAYECEHCHLPFWHVERLHIGTVKR